MMSKNTCLGMFRDEAYYMRLSKETCGYGGVRGGSNRGRESSVGRRNGHGDVAVTCYNADT